jgi:hypothetical protein
MVFDAASKPHLHFRFDPRHGLRSDADPAGKRTIKDISDGAVSKDVIFQARKSFRNTSDDNGNAVGKERHGRHRVDPGCVAGRAETCSSSL